MIKKFFNKKRIVVFFIIYILITAFIFGQSLLSGSKSVETSDFVGTMISDVVSFITGDKIDLKDGDKTEGLYPETISLSGVPARLTIGKEYHLQATLNPLGIYPLSKLTYTSTDENIITVSSTGTITPLSPGACSVTVTDTLSGVSASASFYVSSDLYSPTLTFQGVASNDNVDATEHVYYSPSTGAGIMYALCYQSELKNLTATVTEGNADIINTNGKVWFVTKSVGPLTIRLTGEYKNANGNQLLEGSYTINVREGTFNQYVTPFRFVNGEQTIELEKGETASILTNSTEYFTGLEPVQKAVYGIYDKDLVSLTASGQSFYITAKKVGETPLNVYTAGPNGLTVNTVNIVVKKSLPTVSQIVTPSTFIANGTSTRITVVGDDTTYLASEFDWTVEGVSDYTFNGDKLTVMENGTITLKATHKTIQGFTVERTIEVKYSFAQNVRKFVGHFLLFFTLSLFAYAVYKRLAEIVSPKKALLLTVVFTLLAGVLTATISELLQLNVFTTERGASVIDALIDFSGFLLGTAILFVIDFIKKLRA